MFSALAIILLTQAASTTPAEFLDRDVVVVGSRERYKLNMRALRAAQSEFLSQRERYAPKSSLSFLVTGRGNRSVTGKMMLYFTDGYARTRVPVASNGTFDLATLPPGKWWIESNLSRKDITIEPLTLSFQSSRRDYRLGDARLQCRVIWSMAKADTSILVAPIIGAMEIAGPCTGRKVGIYVRAPGLIKAATLIEGLRAVPVSVGRNRQSYRLPVTDQTFSNEARIKIVTE